MNSPKSLKKSPLPTKFLISPVESARIIGLTGQGIGWVVLLWALDYIFQSPLTVSRWLLRASESPVSGLTTLWSFFVKASLLKACVAAGLGTLLYYRKRRSDDSWELWNCIIVSGYCFAPYTLLVALSACLGHAGFDSPWLLHHRGASATLSDVQSVIAACVVLIYWALCFRGVPLLTAKRIHRPMASVVVLIIAGSLALTGQFISDNAERARPLMQGDSLPDFLIYDASGTKRMPNESKGRVILIDIWATWCGPCVAAMPQLEKIHRKFSNDSFELLSINVEPSKIKEVIQFKQDHNLSFPIFFDRGQARRRLMVSLYPTLILVDENGKIQSVYNGTLGLSALEADIESLVTKAR
ncbi:MAG: TlpA family protein disulfide reductase [Deltaproteobacteria bacterium]|nr:TlpA family protein disulfide reductase [Deltaproteobacteria bacterium]